MKEHQVFVMGSTMAIPVLFLGLLVIGWLWSKWKRELSNDRGIVLMIVLMIMPIMMIMAMTFLTLALRETEISKNYTSHTQAFYVAEGGLATARQLLKMTDDWTTLDGATGDCSILTDTCSYVVAILQPDLAVVTSSASFRRANSSVRSAFTKYDLPDMPGGITSLGPGDVAFSGNAFSLDGNNWIPPSGGTPESQDNFACGTIPVPKWGIAVKDAATQQDVFDGLTVTQQDNILGAPSAPPIGVSSIGVDATIDPVDIVKLADALIKIASDTYAPGTSLSSVSLGTQSDPIIVAVDATGYAGTPAFTLNASDGAGILIVKNGALRLSGSTTWTGLVILVGEGASLDMAGGGDKAIYGAVVVVETVNPSATIATGGGNLKVRYSCDGLDVAELAAERLRASQVWWTEVL